MEMAIASWPNVHLLYKSIKISSYSYKISRAVLSTLPIDLTCTNCRFSPNYNSQLSCRLRQGQFQSCSSKRSLTWVSTTNRIVNEGASGKRSDSRNFLNNLSVKFSSSRSAAAVIEIMEQGKVTLDVKEVEEDGKAKQFQNLDEFESFFANIDAVMFDCDGVLWLGPTVLPKAPELVKKLRAVGKKVFFMTNNSTKTREEFMKKFNNLGFEATMDEIVSTSYLAALYLKEIGFSKKVYTIGSTGVTRELEAVGISCLPIGPDVIPPEMLTWSSDYLENCALDAEVGAVVVGFDQHFSYAKLFKAASYLSDPGCIFIATNTDESFPSANKMVIPGTGSIVVSVKTAAGREPIIMGKPSRIPFEYVQRKHNLEPSRVLMVGDRGNTDILFGKSCGLHTLLVLTGVTSLDDVRNWEKSSSLEERDCVPQYIMTNVAELYSWITKIKI